MEINMTAALTIFFSLLLPPSVFTFFPRLHTRRVAGAKTGSCFSVIGSERWRRARLR